MAAIGEKLDAAKQLHIADTRRVSEDVVFDMLIAEVKEKR
jgi:hypothetical protein